MWLVGIIALVLVAVIVWTVRSFRRANTADAQIGACFIGFVAVCLLVLDILAAIVTALV